jgi:cobalamin biosynthesis protein CbiG
LATQKFGFGTVAGYRLYGLDGVNKVASGEWLEAEDDQAAIEAAKAMMDGHDCELWSGSRLVARLPSRANDRHT